MKILCITPIKHLNGVFTELSKHGDVKYQPDFTRSDLKSYLNKNDVDWIFTNPNKQNFILDGSILKGSSIKGINTASTGMNHIDLDYCEENNIEVWSLKDDYELINDLPSTSELAFGLMMSLLRKIPSGFDHVKRGDWDYEPFVGHQVKGKTIGVVGYGRLGKIMCRLFDGWNVNLLGYDPNEFVTTAKGVPMDDLLNESDVVFLHVHVTDDTRGMVDEEFLSKMKKGSYLINTSRGELVDEDSIIKSIGEGHLNGYGTDVIADEFGEIKKSKLVEMSRFSDKIIITPHVGGMTIEGQTKAYRWAVRKFK
tara:strand:- start:398 stop:1327 length:930 start_codon:yes stop_codon:yes gene_type:complete